MKTRIILFLYIAGAAMATGCSRYPASLSDRWAFDESSGVLAADAKTADADSIHYIFLEREPFGEPVRKKGIAGYALDFDGYSSFIRRDASEFHLPEGSFSISVWVAPRAFEHGDEGKLSAIVNQQDTDRNQGFSLGLFRHGKWSFQIGDGDEWYELWDNGHPVPRRQWSFLTATFDAGKGMMAIYLNGEKIASKAVRASKVSTASVPLLIGRHNQPARDGRTLLNMYCGLMDDLAIYGEALSPEEVRKLFKSYLGWSRSEIPALSYEDIKIDREKYRNDPNRPQMHANPPGHWMNEPHAPFYYNGKYHLTYQHNPTGPYWHNIHWGHWVSDDLVHWKDVPEAIFPEDNDVAPDGIWSGSATFDADGRPMLVYTFGNWNKERNQGVALAFPKDPQDPDLTEWVTQPHTAIEQQEGQGITGEFRDPFAWRDEQTGKWFMIVGSGIQGKGGTAWAYESDNALDWTLKGPFYLSNYAKYDFLGDKWELPVFLPLGQYPDGETRYVFIVSPKGYRQNVEVYYWLGRFDKENVRFIPDDEEPLYWDYGGNRFIGPSGFIDPKGRALIFTVVGGNGTGWAGTCGFPSHIFLDGNGKLGVKPIEELQSLRKDCLLSIENKTLSEAEDALKAVGGDMLEIELEMDAADAKKAGLVLRKSAGGEEETLLYYDAVGHKLLKDNTKSRIRTQVQGPGQGPRPGGFMRRSTDERENLRNRFELADEETLKMHVFIDKGLIQAYVNDRNTVTFWANPSLESAKGLALISEDGSASVKSLKVWELTSIYY